MENPPENRILSDDNPVRWSRTSAEVRLGWSVERPAQAVRGGAVELEQLARPRRLVPRGYISRAALDHAMTLAGATIPSK